MILKSGGFAADLEARVLKKDPELQSLLAAGLAALDWLPTRARGDWLRFAKFTRGAMYVLPDGSLHFSSLSCFEPEGEVQGPILEQVFNAGLAAELSATSQSPSASRTRSLPDADVLLRELGGSNADNS